LTYACARISLVIGIGIGLRLFCSVIDAEENDLFTNESYIDGGTRAEGAEEEAFILSQTKNPNPIPQTEK
jgi:hypothetical protein